MHHAAGVNRRHKRRSGTKTQSALNFPVPGARSLTLAVETEHCGRETLQPVLVSAQQPFKTKLAKEATVLRKNPTHCKEKTSALTRLAAGVWG